MISTIIVLGLFVLQNCSCTLSDDKIMHLPIHTCMIYLISQAVNSSENLYKIGEYEDIKRNQRLENVALLFFIQMKTENPSNILINNNKSKL